MSGGWNKERVAAFKAAFWDFLQYWQIASKDYEGFNIMKLYNSQRYALSEIFSGLEADVHYFVILKARQLGITSIVRPLLIFWCFMHEGLRLALIYDTDAQRNEARAEIRSGLERLPASHRIAIKKGGDNRDYLEFENGSRISYFVAGVKKSKGSGGLGRGRGVNCCGCTEMSSWADLEGVKAFERSLSDKHPDRLYIWESTARGFDNPFPYLWDRAKDDDLAKKAIFIGWWAKETYAHAKGTALYERYGSDPPTEEEQRKIRIVKERYGHDVTMEQLAWYRHEFDPQAEREDDAESEGDEITRQELPWFEEEAWILTGSQFFSSEKLTQMILRAREAKYKGYRYFMGEHFETMECEQVRVPRLIQLKVWEEPDPEGIYVVAADPAYGASEESDRYCIQVLRCYADGVDQVAEFNVAKLETYQFAWVIAHLCGVYKTVRMLLEINGPGAAVLNAFRELQNMAQSGTLPQGQGLNDFTHVFDHVRHYLYARQDAISRNPTGFHWLTSTKLKVAIMERLRDYTGGLNQLNIRSVQAIEEMQKIERDGDSIKGAGTSKDDRVITLAMGLRCYEDGERSRLRTLGRTREAEAKRRSASHADLQVLFSQSIFSDFLGRRAAQRRAVQQQARRGRRYQW